MLLKMRTLSMLYEDHLTWLDLAKLDLNYHFKKLENCLMTAWEMRKRKIECSRRALCATVTSRRTDISSTGNWSSCWSPKIYNYRYHISWWQWLDNVAMSPKLRKFIVGFFFIFLSIVYSFSLGCRSQKADKLKMMSRTGSFMLDALIKL